ncbi:imidazoleglycerol-phosphate dehydratase HisB [Candidatus Micrarchaeota archaeon]|nr:imidazoleglycerol-phosphate dehydratase HisB [Candidatus Micrarchaeota archaeon]
MRNASIQRKTNETDVRVSLGLDGSGNYDNQTGVAFFDHMLDLFSKHSGFDVSVRAQGDLDVDAHHTIEDVGIVLGQAFNQALGDKKGVMRYGWACVPMDEALALCAVDFGGRSHAVVDCPVSRPMIGNFPTELVADFFEAFAQNAKANVHVKLLYGRNDHHKIEACFKAFAKACRQAVAFDEKTSPDALPTTKGVL